MPENKDRVFLALLLAMAALQGLPDQAQHAVEYQRSALLSGQFWRLLSGHFIHLGPAHLALNSCAFVLFWFMYRLQFSASALSRVTLILAVTTSFCMLALMPGLDWYRGLSGILHGLFVAGAISALRKADRLQWLVLALLVVKLAREQIVGPSLQTADLIGANVVVNAHLYGALAGALYALLPLVIRRPSRIDHPG